MLRLPSWRFDFQWIVVFSRFDFLTWIVLSSGSTSQPGLSSPQVYQGSTSHLDCRIRRFTKVRLPNLDCRILKVLTSQPGMSSSRFDFPTWTVVPSGLPRFDFPTWTVVSTGFPRFDFPTWTVVSSGFLRFDFLTWTVVSAGLPRFDFLTWTVVSSGFDFPTWNVISSRFDFQTWTVVSSGFPWFDFQTWTVVSAGSHGSTSQPGLSYPQVTKVRLPNLDCRIRWFTKVRLSNLDCLSSGFPSCGFDSYSRI